MDVKDVASPCDREQAGDRERLQLGHERKTFEQNIWLEVNGWLLHVKTVTIPMAVVSDRDSIGGSTPVRRWRRRGASRAL